MCWSLFGAIARHHTVRLIAKKDIDEGIKLGEYELLLVVVFNGAGSMCTSSCGAKIGVESL